LWTGCDSSVEPSAVTSSPIIGGSRDLSDAAVVAIQQRSTGTLCTGVVVASDLVLTAAHCAFGVAAGDLQVLVGPIVMTPAQTVAVARAVIYPTYQGESEGLTGGVDLAFLTLATPLSVTTIPVRTDATAAELDGADVTVVGYGASDGTDNSGAGFRLQVVLQISKVCSRLFHAGGADANVCVGDSGGAVLMGGEIVAIVSGGQPGCFAPAIFTRTDAHADWIRAALAGRPLTPCPECVEPDPSCTASTETGHDGGTGDAEAFAATSSGPSARGWSCSVKPGRRSSGALEAGLVIVLAASVARRRTLRVRAAGSPRR
jgi:secreted trypsin-like serine protease